ncbi:MAG: 4Fe-4S dicluster domain-containing protein [Candidatus Altiarchaeota archaeon]|nr:4Fe-4S dicluster domain-containing protein [Candidatus Altiarchaeota archaeon]
MALVLEKRRLDEYLSWLSRSFTVYAPVERDGLVKFDGRSSGDSVVLDYDTTNTPPKFLFLPHGECMLEFKGEKVKVPAVDERFVVFMNSVDAEAVSILDEVFGGEFNDEYYARRRANSIIVAVESEVKMRDSFDEELDLKFKNGFDVLFTDCGDCYLVEAKTAKGKKLMKSDSIKETKKSIKDRRNFIKDRKLDLGKISAFLDKGPEQKIWQDLAKECFACGICAYVCPICHCFDVQDDVKLEGGGCRKRDWDSCMLADFALVAGGVNFRGERHKRIHNWYHHKFARAVSERGRPDCVGCGRCITYCPAKIRIHEKIRECEK